MTERTSPPCPRRPGRMGRVGCGIAVVAVLVLGGATPAGAVPEKAMSIDPTGDVTGSPTVTGSFKGSSLLVNVEKITTVDLKVSPTGPTGGSPITQDGCAVASGGSCNSPQISFSWGIPSLAYNGPYVVEATGMYCDPLLCLNPEAAAATPVEFRLGAEPRAPSDLKVEPGGDRHVVASWARNSEPDLLYYALFRKDPGGDFRRLGNDIKQPASGRPTFTDTSVAATNGGDFVYRVFAVRQGFSGDEQTTKISSSSTDRTATVAAPPTTTVAPGADPDAPPVTIAGEGVDISSFLSSQDPTLPTPPPIFLDLPDTGFGESLPFGALPGDDVEPGEEDAVLPQTPRQRELAEFKRGRPLIPVAAGAVLLLLAGHIRLLSVRTKPAPEKLPPGTYVARALEAARSKQIPVDVVMAAANGGHHRPPPVDDVAGLPVWAEFEPVSAMGLLDAADYEDELSANGEYELYAPHYQSDLERQPEAAPEPARKPVREASALQPDPEHYDDGLLAFEDGAEPDEEADDDDADEILVLVSESDTKHEAERVARHESDHDEADGILGFEAELGAESELEDDDEDELPAFESELEDEEEDELATFPPEAELEPEELLDMDLEGELEPEHELFAVEPGPGLGSVEPDPEPLYSLAPGLEPVDQPDRAPAPAPARAPEKLYAFEDEPEWSGEPEVFVSPRR